MARHVLRPAADIEHVGGAMRLAAPLLKRRPVNAGESGRLGQARGARFGLLLGGGGDGCGKAARLGFQLQAVEQPSPRAVMQHVDVIGHASGHQAQPAQNAARRAHAIDHHLGRGVRNQVVKVAQHIGPWRINAAGNIAPDVLGGRTAVQHDPVFIAAQGAIEFAWANQSRTAVTPGKGAEALRRHFNFRKERKAGRRPGRRAAVEHGDIGVAKAFEPLVGARRQLAAAVGKHDARGPARRQVTNVQLQTR